jgi:hypothetical protein
MRHAEARVEGPAARQRLVTVAGRLAGIDPRHVEGRGARCGTTCRGARHVAGIERLALRGGAPRRACRPSCWRRSPPCLVANRPKWVVAINRDVRSQSNRNRWSQSVGARTYGVTARSLHSSRCGKKSDQPPPRTPLGYDENVAGTPRKTLPTEAFLTVKATYAVLRASRSGGMRPIGRLRAMPMFADANPCDREDLRQFPCLSISISAQTDRRPGGWMNSAGGTGGGR